MKKAINGITIVSVGIYLAINIFSILIGFLSATMPSTRENCNHKIRAEHFFPGYRLGCWLGGEE